MNFWNETFGFLKIESSLTNFFELGTLKINKNLDIIKILKDIKYHKVLVQVMLQPTHEMKFQIYHNQKNVIDIDSEGH